MRAYRLGNGRFAEVGELPDTLPPDGFVWIACERPEFEQRLADVQAALQRLAGGTLLDLHVSDLLNDQLPSHFDYTSWYDLMVFRRLRAAVMAAAQAAEETPSVDASARAVASIDTRPVGFAVFDRVLLTVHPADCPVRNHFVQRLQQTAASAEPRGASRMPLDPADLMLRMVNHIVDSYLDLRRLLTKQFGRLEHELLERHSRIHDWRQLLDARNALNLLEDTCEDQRAAVQEWIDALDEWPAAADERGARERELLRVRSRDVLEHIERVLAHVRRLEASAESAVQMQFSLQSQRTNDIMRTLTVLTAIFLPLNLITGFFGMNFDALPLIHRDTGVWIAVALMAAIGVGLIAFFWRKRYLTSRGRSS